MSIVSINQITTRKALQALEIFRALDTDMPIGEAVAFLLIALGETKDGGGLTVTEVGQQGGFSLASASRHMKSLNKIDRYGKAGHELVIDPRDPKDDRRKVLKLTHKGRTILNQIEAAIGA